MRAFQFLETDNTSLHHLKTSKYFEGSLQFKTLTLWRLHNYFVRNKIDLINWDGESLALYSDLKPWALWWWEDHLVQPSLTSEIQSWPYIWLSTLGRPPTTKKPLLLMYLISDVWAPCVPPIHRHTGPTCQVMILPKGCVGILARRECHSADCWRQICIMSNVYTEIKILIKICGITHRPHNLISNPIDWTYLWLR